MNRLTAGLFIASLLLAACAENRMDILPVDSKESPEFYASFEDNAVSGTKTYVDGRMTLRWTKDDRVSIFVGNTYNQEYKYAGETGANNGTFSAMQTPGFVAADKLDANYAVYPYSAANEMDKDGGMSVVLPAVQHYAENSFGLGSNTMVAVTEDKSDMTLQFRNLCGYLVVKLYGEGTVSSVTLEGNNGEKISGKADVEVSYGTQPSVVMADDATTSITIDCGDGVTLGTTAETATEFWFCVPPVTFTEGFTIKVQNSDGMGMTKSVTSSRFITRNTANTMAPLETLFEAPTGKVAFADANFKAYCVQHFDTDGDGEISKEEALAVTEIIVDTKDISSLGGIEYFTNLEILDCSLKWLNGQKSSSEEVWHYYDLEWNELSSKLTALDVSKNIALTYLNCGANQLTVLDVSKNTALTKLNCQGNQLTTLDVSKNTALTNLQCWDNRLTSLDVSKNTALIVLYCSGNQLISLDVSKNVALFWLNCSRMNDNNGNNTLKYVIVNSTQSLEGITINRSNDKVPDETQIIVKGQGGDNEDYREGGEG